jgi:hypothetical protein
MAEVREKVYVCMSNLLRGALPSLACVDEHVSRAPDISRCWAKPSPPYSPPPSIVLFVML